MKVLCLDFGIPQDEETKIFQLRKSEPFGLLCVAGVLEAVGHQVAVQVHFDFEQFTAFNPDVVAMSLLTFQDPLSRRVAQQIKSRNRGIVVIAGGPHATGYPELALDPNIDAVVIGEGERVIVDLLAALERGADLRQVRGIAFTEAGKLIKTAPAPPIMELDELPLPLRFKALLDTASAALPRYDVDGTLSPRSAQISYSRGCPFNCTFCLSPLIWQRIVRYRSPQRVVQEMREIIRRFGITFFAFSDLTFNLHPKMVRALCKEIIKEKLRVHWHAMCSPSYGDVALYKLMKRAGCVSIGWGIETAVSLRERYKKPQVSFRRMQEVLAASDEAGILDRGYLLVGHPEETREDLHLTQQMLQNLPLTAVSAKFLVPFPGTQDWQRFKNQLLTSDFRDFTTNVPVIRSPHFSPEELLENRRALVHSFFSREAFRSSLEKRMEKFPELRRPLEAFWESLSKDGLV